MYTNVSTALKRDTSRSALSPMRLTLEISGISRSDKPKPCVLVAAFPASQLCAACEGAGVVRGTAVPQSNAGTALDTAASPSPAPTVELRCRGPQELLEENKSIRTNMNAAASKT